MPPTIIFIRHGETDWNVEGRLQGHVDVPINAKGRDQARRNGRTLRSYLRKIGRSPDDFDWVSSPMARCTETMDLVLAELGCPDRPYRLSETLLEMSFGTMEGLTKDELKLRDRDMMRRRRDFKWSFVPTGGESYAQLFERIKAWYHTVDRDTVAVSHGGVSRVLRGCLQNTEPNDIPFLEVPQDRIHVLRGSKMETV